MDLCVLEEEMFKSLSMTDDAKKALAQVIHISAYQGEESQVRDSGKDEVEIKLYLKDKNLFGRTFPYYCFCFGSVAGKGVSECIEIPAARFLLALQRMVHTYASDRLSADESFSSWGARKGTPFFTELLEGIVLVGPEDMHELIEHLQENLQLIS
ncbi:MAG: hypothetical protein OEZ43_04505 [Gammaproteobacteria bacterium]|nr:hypothetical protein [Gammaproteobacteria bacterium]